jgi:eukaryotic-like serine/threonine-protein kinase
MTIATETTPTTPTPAGESPPADARRTTARLLEAHRQEARGASLGTRLFVGFALFLALTLALVIAFAQWDSQRRAERRVSEAMGPVPEIFDGYVGASAEADRNKVRSVAEAVGTKALLALAGTDVDSATFHDSALELANGLGAGAVFLFDAEGRLLARSDRAAGEEAGRDFSAIAWVAGPLASGEVASAFILETRRSRTLSLVAAAPVSQGEGSEARVNGLVAAAFPVADAQAADLGRLISGQAAFLGNVARRGAPPAVEVLAATPRLRAAAAALVATPGAVVTLFDAGQPFGPFDFTAADEVYIGTAVPVSTAAGEPIAAFLGARSKTAELATFRALRWGVLAVGLVALALSLPASYALARRVSRPIEQLAAGAEALRQGQLDIELPKVRGREVSMLARAFDALIVELKEKRALVEVLASVRQPAARGSTLTTLSTGAMPAADAPAGTLAPGQLFANRFRILAQLGGGGMGRVYRAHDLELEDDVALKILNPQLFAGSERALRLLRKETKAARAITHSNVVRVHDLGEAEGLRFLSMEYVAGTTLRKLLDQRRRLDLAPGLQFAKQLCRGLSAVHAAGIVHGDVKPENLMALPNGLVKLMDFGVATRAGVAGDERPGYAIGTPVYMSPEQARGGELDERSDIYAAGVVMFEIFTGQAPFQADSVADLLSQHLYASPPDPCAGRPEIPRLLGDVILQCLAKSRLERPASAGELDRALMRVRT